MKHVLPVSLLCGLLVAVSPAARTQDQRVPSPGAVASPAQNGHQDPGAQPGHEAEGRTPPTPGAVAPRPVVIDPARLTTSNISPFPVPQPSGGHVALPGACDCVGGIPEGEPNCGIPTDTVNGGCNYGPPYLFTPINLNETYCGTAAFDGSLRDTDWYELVLTATTDVTWTVTGDFDILAGILDGSAGCPGGGFLAYDFASGCADPAVVSATLPPGTWWFFAAADFTSVLPCGESYTATLSGPAGNCDCAGGLPEGEPNCGIPTDTVNGGCNYGPPYLFTPINLGDTYCGTTAFDGSVRDTDWYEITLVQPTDVTWTVQGDFDVLAGIIDGSSGCPAGGFYAYDYGYGCGDPAVVSATLPAGTWWFWVGPDFTNVLACGESYTATLDGSVGCDCTGGIPEGEANCGIPTDTVNGGCNYGPPYLFTPINLGDRFCGTTAFDGSIRDTDWYEIVLTQTTDLTWTVKGNFDVVAGIIDGSAGCPVSSFYAYDDGHGCDDPAVVSAVLPPGVWWFWVGPDFTNPLACGESYTADLFRNVQATATFRNDAGGTNPAGYVAAPPVMGALWNASVDNSLTGNTFADIVGYKTPLSLYLAGLGDYLLVNVADPNGELLLLSATAGGGVVSFSAVVPQDPVFAGFDLATQGYGFGGGGPRLQNAFDLVIGSY